MRVEQRDDGALVSGFLDTEAGCRDTVLVRGAYPYQAEMRSYHFGALNACDISGGADHRVTPACHHDECILGLFMSGRGALEQEGRLVPLAAGDFVLYRGERPFRLELSGPYRFFVVSLGPGDAGYLRHAGPVIANPGLPRFGSARILGAALPEIAELAGQMGPLTRQEMGERITCMLRTLVKEASAPGTCNGVRHVPSCVPPGGLHHLSLTLPLGCSALSFAQVNRDLMGSPGTGRDRSCTARVFSFCSHLRRRGAR